VDKDSIIQRLDEAGGIYGYLYGCRKEKISFISKKSLHVWSDALVEVWGWPGPDYTKYKFEDYGKTWAFSMDDFVDDEETDE